MNALDLCSGAAGGWSLGLHRAGIRTVAACEAVDWRRDLYAQNNPGVKLYDDVRTLNGATVRRDTGISPDLVAGSPPCKEYSPAGRGRGLDADDLYLHAVRIVDELRPRWCAFENSHFLKTRGFDRIATSLEAIGYAVWPQVVGLGNAAASNQRQRSVVIGLDTHATRPQRRPTRLARLGSDASGADGSLPGPDWGRRCTCEGSGGGDCPDLVSGGGCIEERAARIAGVFRGPVGSANLSCHLRAYAGIPAGASERAREAYGDAFAPVIAEAVGRAILQVEDALWN